MIQVTVQGSSMTTAFLPLGSSPAVDGSFSPQIYGNQGTTVSVSGVVDSLHDVMNVSRTWFLHVRIRNLLAYPIGSNYGANNAAPPDTSGVFVLFSSLPVITIPSPCSGCAVNVNNAMGSGTFSAPSQKYFWYRNRPSAMQGSPGTDTTDFIEWQFKTTSFTAPDTAHAFTFVLLVSAAWSPPNETSWLTQYNATTDSLPDTKAEPRWQIFSAPSTQLPGTEAWIAGTELVLSTATGLNSVYLGRHDSLGTMSAFMDVRASATVTGGTPRAIFGFAEPSGNKQVFVGLFGDGVEFVTFNEVLGTWSMRGLADCQSAGCKSNVYRSYRLRKFGADSVVLCATGVRVLGITHGALQNTSASWTGRTTVFGTGGAANTTKWSSVSYTIGSDGGSC